MTRALTGIVVSVLAGILTHTIAPTPARADYQDFDQPPHDYWKRPLGDPFTRIKADLEAGRITLDGSSERAYVTSLLDRLSIPVSSQLLVFSTTSLQLRFKHGITGHQGNALGDATAKGVTRTPIELSATVQDLARYPAATSDVLPHLLHEHQVGFVNRLIAAVYRTRSYLHEGGGTLSPAHAERLDDQANILTRYLLFADEAALPAGGVTGDAAFKQAFLRARKSAKDGTSLRDLDGKTRLFKHRCSYMIYSQAFAGLPREVKQRVYRRLLAALSTANPDPAYAYLPPTEKKAILTILEETLADLPTARGILPAR